MTCYDFIIVGAGAAGCVIAHNLVKAGFRVALVEAGGDYDSNYYVQIPQLFGNLWNPITYPPDYKKCSYDPPWDSWDLKTYAGCTGSHSYCYPRASGRGGSASHHAMVTLRGSDSVYEYWEDVTGDPDWGPKNMNITFDHIQEDWLQVTCTEPEKAELDFMLNVIRNHNIPFTAETSKSEPGIGFWSFSIDRQTGQRCNSSTHLLSRVQDNPLLHIFLHSFVTKIIICPKTKRAIGIEYKDAPYQYKADTLNQCSPTDVPIKNMKARLEVILCGGSINSPQLLLLSGVGPCKDLVELEIKCIHDNQEVGSNLIDHPECWVNYVLDDKCPRHRWQTFWPFLLDSPVHSEFKKCGIGPCRYPFSATGLTHNNDDGCCWHIGIYTIPSNNFCIEEWFYNYDYANTTYLSFLIENVCPKSSGYLKLQSKDPTIPPFINERLDTDENADCIAAGVRFLDECMRTMDDCYDKPIRVYPPPDTDIRDFFKCNSAYGHHMGGTCSMMKVVDSNGCVYGIKRLRVADLSIVPYLPTVNPSFPVYAIADIISRKIIRKYCP